MYSMKCIHTNPDVFEYLKAVFTQMRSKCCQLPFIKK